ncbi:MAG TPA: di-heme oxidoredictase family protein [Vicinamibacterales bacterium]|nr:di-heme oxidoredictase family protein [Vicinamibacterales bacterium]
MTRPLGAIAVAALVLAAAIAAAQSPSGGPGAPLAGITAVEFEEFRLGLDDFTEVEAAEEGLGPAFNGTSCAVCHNVPAIGGGGLIAEIRAGRRNAQGEFETLDASGETLFHLFSVPGHGCQPMVPVEANVFARRVPIPLFGAGLVEAIPDETLRALEDPADRDRDGVSGRAALVTDVASGERRVGRFGWKAQHATLLAFGADAYRNEMGITNDLFPAEVAYGVSAAQMRLCDRFPDPEDIRDPLTRRRGIDNFASFMRLLAPVARGGVDDEVRAGEQVFTAIGCAACHVPALQTGPSANPVFHRKVVPLFSDLLLHDIGTGDGIRQGVAASDEIRTPALWGLRLRRPLLHDGSAATPEDAIRRHGGEAELARRGFERLSDADRAALRAFLRSL